MYLSVVKLAFFLGDVIFLYNSLIINPNYIKQFYPK